MVGSSHSSEKISRIACQARTILDALDISPVALHATLHIHLVAVSLTATLM